MSNKLSKWTVLPAAVLLLGTVTMAQGTSTPSATPAPDPTIGQRKENQQDRIANGVKSGQLTAGETSNLETKEAAINGETRADRAANGGKLTAAEKTQVNQQQNQVSKQIYNDKHNANTAKYGNNQVGQRRENQQDRIAKGINQQVKADRSANGGKLTPGEKQQVNKEQNAASKNIYNKKHNGNMQPKK